MAWEHVKVPVGEFDCLRIESTWTRMTYDARSMSRPNYSSSTDYVDWLCPAVGNVAREETIWRDGYGHTTRTVSELVVYGPKR